MAERSETSSPKIGNAKQLVSKTLQPVNKSPPTQLAAQRGTPSLQRENAWPNLRSRGKASPLFRTTTLVSVTIRLSKCNLFCVNDLSH